MNRTHPSERRNSRGFHSVVLLLGIIFPVLFANHTASAQTVLYQAYTDRGKAAYESGDRQNAAKFLELALGEAEKLSDDELIADSSTNLGKVLQSLGQFDRAEELYLKSIRLFDKLDGVNGERSTYALNNLGLLYAEQKKFEKAEQILRRTIDVREKLFGSADPDVGVTLLNLGKLYADQKRLLEADAVLARALEVFLEYPEMFEEILVCLHNISNVATELKHYKRAESVLKVQIAIIEKRMGTSSPELAVPLDKYAKLLRLQKRNVEAAKIERRLKVLTDK